MTILSKIFGKKKNNKKVQSAAVPVSVQNTIKKINSVTRKIESNENRIKRLENERIQHLNRLKREFKESQNRLKKIEEEEKAEAARYVAGRYITNINNRNNYRQKTQTNTGF